MRTDPLGDRLTWYLLILIYYEEIAHLQSVPINLILAYEAVDEHDKVGLQHELSLTRSVDVRHACKLRITN